MARQYGAETPFMRPAEFAQDTSLDLPVFEHALELAGRARGLPPRDRRPAAPHLAGPPARLVDEAVQLLLEHPEANSVRGVVPAGQNPHKMWRIDPESGRMHNLLQVEGIAEPYNAPRQALPPVYWQTGHIDAIRPSTIRAGFDERRGDPARDDRPGLHRRHRHPQRLAAAPSGWCSTASWTSSSRPRRRPLPEKVDLVVFDFDGVMTDNRVWVDEDGHEMVAANRCDAWALPCCTRRASAVVLSTETNPVVAARCRKMDMPIQQGLGNKAAALRALLAERRVDPAQWSTSATMSTTCPASRWSPAPVVVADAHPAARQQADIVLSRAAVMARCANWRLFLSNEPSPLSGGIRCFRGLCPRKN